MVSKRMLAHFPQLQSKTLQHIYIVTSRGRKVPNATNVLTQILRLQQICSGSTKNDDDETVDIPTNKMDELLAVIDEVEGKIIIWSIFVNDILKITDMLNDNFGMGSAAAFHGATKPEDRQNIVEKFQQPDSKLRFFVGNPKVGGMGLTLTEAKTVIYYNNLYDLEVRLQSEDRAHRIGQKNNVTYIDLVTENTVEEKILKALILNILSTESSPSITLKNLPKRI